MAVMRRLGGMVFGLALALWPLLATAAEPAFPELTGRVVDDAGLLSYPDKVSITADLKALEDKSSDQLIVVTLPSLQGYPIEEFGYRLGRHWGIGTAKLDNGVVLIVAPKERKVRIEVGTGLEGTLTDALSRIVIENSDPAALSRRRLRRRHQERDARHRSRAHRRRRRGRGARQGAH